MSKLADLQYSMVTQILQPEAVSAAFITATDPADSQRRIRVYHYAYRARMAEALAGNYPMLYALLGDELWGKVAQGYLEAYPSSHFSLRYFGAHLSSWLDQSQILHDARPVADLGRLEWALANAFDSHDAQPLTMADIAALDAQAWPTLCVAAHPSVSLLHLQFAVGPLWHALQDNPDSVPPPVADPAAWLVWRVALDTHFRSLDPIEAAIFKLASQGATFTAWCEQAAALMPVEEAPNVVVRFLQRWLVEGVLVAVE